jgi:hypothetical protein
MAQIFLSYASQDRPRAKAFAEALRERGWSVFWDRTVPPGKVFDQVIDEALSQALCVVVLWSRASVESNWVKDEITDAAQRGTLVPALIDDVALPLGFRRLQAARLVGWPDVKDSQEFDQLVASIDALVGAQGGRAAPAPPPPRSKDAPPWAPLKDERWFKATEPIFQVANHLAMTPLPVATSVRKFVQTAKIAGVLVLFTALGFAAGGAMFEATREDAAAFAVAIPVWAVGVILTVRAWLKQRRATRNAVPR